MAIRQQIHRLARFVGAVPGDEEAVAVLFPGLVAVAVVLEIGRVFGGVPLPAGAVQAVVPGGRAVTVAVALQGDDEVISYSMS